MSERGRERERERGSKSEMRRKKREDRYSHNTFVQMAR